MTELNRRDVILDGVISVLAERGLAGVTHRAVDQVSGLPQGSCTYYFPRKADLLVAVSARLVGLLEKDCDELQVGFADIVAREGMEAGVSFVADEVVAYAEVHRHLFLARIELTLAASRLPELAGVSAELTAAARRPIAFFLQLITDGRHDVPIATCAGLIDGIGLMHATGQGPKPTAEQVAAVFRSVL
ncbi:TetR/AcrR family transcriptional regulator [Algicella marina]|uniref:TetR family transcriptional regulator n=1 Tax=Algicella marina TaxID=2683284 RepID=A0A6P1SZ89_9RHOB|nr:TetR family transcriptional regulator [Algicella marina]QHQ34536.1 TetR family transcriptional regulator [Algicella marina]